METLQLWEEKNLIEPEKNYSFNRGIGPNDITVSIKTDSILTPCENTGNKKKWKKNCPKCGKEQFYKTHRSLKSAIGRNNVCVNCRVNPPKTNEWKNKISKSKSGVPNLKVRKRPYEWIFNRLVRTSKNRKLDCTLNFDDFLQLTKTKNCHYCNNLVEWTPFGKSWIRGGNNKTTSTNIDRMDNTKGYIQNNCCVCCDFCNKLKGNKFTYKEMLLLAETIKQIFKKRNE